MWKGDIPGLTIVSFLQYFLPVAAIYLACWVFFSWYGLKKGKSSFYWLILVIGAMLIPYLVYLPLFQKPYLHGDDFYLFSFISSIANGNFLNDVCYQGYSTYYPPLYHLFIGFLLWFSQLPLLEFLKYVPILNIIMVCVVAYIVVSKIKDAKTGVIFILMFCFISTPTIAYLVRGINVVPGIHILIVRPYPAIAMILLILGLFLFSREKRQDKWWSGLIGGVITLFSIHSLVYYTLSLLVYTTIRSIKTGNYTLHISRLFVVGLVSFLISSVYLVPHLLSVLKHGADKYQWMWTMGLWDYDPYVITFGMGFMGLTFILGVLGIISLPKTNFKLILIITLVILLFGRFHIYITKPLFNMSFTPEWAWFGLVFLFSFTGATFLRDFPIKISFRKWTLQKLKMGHIFLACTFFLPILIWNPVSNRTLYNSFNPISEKIEIITSIINEKTDKDDIILSSNEISPWVLLLTGRHLALSGDPWCSNPTARYSLRYKDFSEAFSSDDINVIKGNLKKWKVDILVFVKDGKGWDSKEKKWVVKEKEKNVHWLFNANAPEYGLFSSNTGLKANIDKSIFGNNDYFTKLYEDEYYAVLRNN